VRFTDLPEPLRAVPELMRGFPAPWCVAGGWALDLYLGRVTRAHADVEIALFRQDQARLHDQFRGWQFLKVIAGRLEPWPAGERLELTVHEIHGRSGGDGRLALEFLLNERTRDDWIFRRDPTVTFPIEQAIVRGALGYPVLCPAIVLLFKCKSPRPKDEADFRVARDELGDERRSWLRGALDICHPEHAWRHASNAPW
jgi:hypothetical protein